LDRAVAQFAATGQPQRLFDRCWYQAGSWERPRLVVVKAEANAQGTNRRYTVTDRRGAELYPAAAYDDYIQRGESENRNKEFKALAGDRLSDHRFCANYFRLYLHAAALNLLALLRRRGPVGGGARAAPGRRAGAPRGGGADPGGAGRGGAAAAQRPAAA